MIVLKKIQQGNGVKHGGSSLKKEICGILSVDSSNINLDPSDCDEMERAPSVQGDTQDQRFLSDIYSESYAVGTC